MNGARTFALASLPAAAGLAWQQHRRVVRAVDSHPVFEPVLPGIRRLIPTRWGSVGYRLVEGDADLPAYVLIHGWGKTSDSGWWPVVGACRATMVVIDLPGHGRSMLHEPFDFRLGAIAVERAVEDAGLDRPVLVGHSMGGAVALTAIRRNGAGAYGGFIAMATSAYWVRPRLRMMMALAPYVMAPRSPFLLRAERSEMELIPHYAERIAWAYTRRPPRRILDESALALRRFDARRWDDLELPPTTWVVATKDAVLDPRHQRASAGLFGADVVECDVQHSMVVHSPGTVLEILDARGNDPREDQRSSQ